MRGDQTSVSRDNASSGAPAPNLAVVLTGGGARAAYQVGYLRWIARNIPHAHFPILTGVSAGAINATFLAAYRGTLAEATERLTQLWQSLTVNQVFRVDSSSLVSHMARWGVRLVSGGGAIAPSVRGLVDTTPLRHTLETVFDLASGGIADRVTDKLRHASCGPSRSSRATTPPVSPSSGYRDAT